MTIKNKETGQELEGMLVNAIIQLSTNPEHTAAFVLYESMEGYGFFLRESDEFCRKFKVVSTQGDDVVWTHKIKGGKYRVQPCLYLFDGDDIEWELGIHDGRVVKAYMYRNGDVRFTNDFDKKFVSVPEQVGPDNATDSPIPMPLKANAAQNFIQYYMDGVTHVALVKRTGCGYVPIRGANLAEVMQAADVLLRIKQ